jgi:hypothetical protein
MTDSTRSQPTLINTWHPTINNTPITNIVQLHTIIHTEYPHLTHHPTYPKLHTDAHRHFDLIHAIQGQTHLSHGDIAKLARTLGVTRTIIYRHVRQALKPRLYWFLDNAIPKTQAHHQLTLINQTNTHIHTLTDLQHRLSTYYPAQFLEQARGQPDRLTQCQKYFHVLTHLAEGGHNYTDLAQTVGKTVNNIKEWCTNQTRPGLLNLARRIPTTPPKPGHQWLPLTMQGRFHPTHFIQVPTTITNWNQIPPVIQQLIPLTNPSMTYWHQQFGPITQDEAFAYLLGNLVSDAGKITPHYTSTRLELSLSTKYTWSQRVGDAVCYYLGQLSIYAEAKKPSPDKHRWRSQNTPLLTWIKHKCLGLTPHQLTTYTPITAPWLLTAPKPIRIKFLQGLNDGDGYANTKYQKLGNASGVNCEFVQELLETLSILSLINGRRVVIVRVNSIIFATELPYFLHATGRQEKAEKLNKMMSYRLLSMKEPVHWKIEYTIKELAKEEMSPGEIAEKIFDEFGVCYYPKKVRKIMKE